MEEKKQIKEDIPANAMGASSSTAGSGAIDIFDPLLKVRKNRRKERIKNMWRRKIPSEDK